MKDRIIEIILWLGFVAATCVLVGPSFIDSMYSIEQAQSIASYIRDAEEMDVEDAQAMFDRARTYNREIAARQLESAFTYLGPDLTDEEYDSLLMLGSEGNIMCYVEVPSADIYLPVAHGTDTHTLIYEAGHMYGTSLPTGGPSTHAVIAGHTGLKSADLFTHLTDTKEGDVFYIHVLGEIHEYTVDRIKVVLPEDEDPYLQVEEGGDYVTLYTCTPYGVNDHRLLVRGYRSGDVEVGGEGGEGIQQKRMNKMAILKAVLFAAIPLLVLIIGGVLVFRKKGAYTEVYIPAEAFGMLLTDMQAEKVPASGSKAEADNTETAYCISAESYRKFKDLVSDYQKELQRRKTSRRKKQ